MRRCKREEKGSVKIKFGGIRQGYFVKKLMQGWFILNFIKFPLYINRLDKLN